MSVNTESTSTHNTRTLLVCSGTASAESFHKAEPTKTNAKNSLLECEGLLLSASKPPLEHVLEPVRVSLYISSSERISEDTTGTKQVLYIFRSHSRFTFLSFHRKPPSPPLPPPSVFNPLPSHQKHNPTTSNPKQKDESAWSGSAAQRCYSSH